MEDTPATKKSEAQRRAQKKYYEAHKDEIYQKRRENGRYKKNYLRTYELHREEHSKKALARYHRNKAVLDAFRELAGIAC